MKLNTWLIIQIIKQEIALGNVFVLFYGKVNGSTWYKDYVEVRFRDKIDVKLYYEDTPYTHDELIKSLRVDYIIGHPLTERKVKKTIYKTSVYTDSERLEVWSPSIRAGEMLQKQFDAVDYMDVKAVKYRDCRIDLSSTFFQGISYSEKKQEFNNIIEYNEYEKVSLKKEKSRSVEIV